MNISLCDDNALEELCDFAAWLETILALMLEEMDDQQLFDMFEFLLHVGDILHFDEAETAHGCRETVHCGPLLITRYTCYQKAVWGYTITRLTKKDGPEVVWQQERGADAR